MKRFLHHTTLLWIALFAAGNTLHAGHPDLKTLRDHALETHPGSEAARLEALAATHGARQTKAWANPEIEVEAEGIAGDNSGVDRAEFSVWLTQPLENPALRKARREEARLAVTAADLERMETRRKLKLRVAKLFYDVLSLKLRVAQREAVLERKELFVDLAQRRVTAGSATGLEVNRAQAERTRSRLDLQQTQQAYRTGLTDLQQLCGWPEALTGLRGELDTPPPPPDEAQIAQALRQRAAFRASGLQIEQDEAQVAQARAERFPGLSLALGSRIDQSDDSQTYLAGVGMELPLWNRKGAAIRAARKRQEAARARFILAENEILMEARQLHNELAAGHREIESYRNELIPLLEKSAGQAEESYRQGWIGYLEYQEAQDAFAETSEAQIDALLNYWQHYLETEVE